MARFKVGDRVGTIFHEDERFVVREVEDEFDPVMYIIANGLHSSEVSEPDIYLVRQDWEQEDL